MTDVDSTMGPVLLYDGECGLCQALMRFVLRRDGARRIRVGALQGMAGQALLREAGLPTADFDSLVFFPTGEAQAYLLRTDGVVAVLRMLPGGWPAVGRLLGWWPRAWRDAVYRGVARVRHRLVGKPGPAGGSDPAWADRVLP